MGKLMALGSCSCTPYCKDQRAANLSAPDGVKAGVKVGATVEDLDPQVVGKMLQMGTGLVSCYSTCIKILESKLCQLRS